MSFSAYAPGRAELLGNHTDYNEGLVLSLAINTGTTITGTILDDNRLVLTSRDLPDRYEGSVRRIAPGPEHAWYNYVLGVIQELGHRQVLLGGASLEASSTIPIGAGLSSSAALEAATALFFQKLYPYDLDRLEIAKACQAAEHTYAGVKCGLLDQISVLMAKKDHATFIDCRSFEVRHLPLGGDARFVIVNSGVKHALVAGEYNERRASCEEAARLLGKKALRDTHDAELDAQKDRMPERVWKRAKHITGENRRVALAVDFLAAGNMRAFGKLMVESHESSKVYFENSCEELDFLVETAVASPGCLGARLSGGGFGGATINLVEASAVDAFASAVDQAYRARYGTAPLVVATPACDGAR
ncbi:MAG: galactokinase [Candidatus Methylacidiphilales bacterium]|nr:galactokinase [Candidatus Methylacidiphilales bacterium]